MVLDFDPGPVIVRQHPSERRPGQRSRLDLGWRPPRRFGQDPRYSFVAADDRVSSYDLLDSVDLVLPFTSNIGIEAAALGKTVLVAGASFYADLGFTWSATSREEYLALLRRGLLGDLPPWPEQQERAWLCYYLVAVRNRIWTDFTSRPDDFGSWVDRSPDELFRSRKSPTCWQRSMTTCRCRFFGTDARECRRVVSEAVTRPRAPSPLGEDDSGTRPRHGARRRGRRRREHVLGADRSVRDD